MIDQARLITTINPARAGVLPASEPVGAGGFGIVLLVHDRYRCDRVVNRLIGLGIPARAVDRGAPPADRAQMMTMHRPKGIEFSKVISR
jgi:hypothetical protein